LIGTTSTGAPLLRAATPFTRCIRLPLVTFLQIRFLDSR
jgi:hypothetical protein